MADPSGAVPATRQGNRTQGHVRPSELSSLLPARKPEHTGADLDCVNLPRPLLPDLRRSAHTRAQGVELLLSQLPAEESDSRVEAAAGWPAGCVSRLSVVRHRRRVLWLVAPGLHLASQSVR